MTTGRCAMIPWRSLRLAGSGEARSAVAGWLGALGGAVDALVFPWSCAVCGAEG